MKQTNRFILLFSVLAVFAAGLLVAGCGSDTESSKSSTGSDESTNSSPRMPAFSLDRLGGGLLGHQDLLGKPAVLNFGASWCGPCELEAPVFAKAQTSYPEVGFFGIAVKDSDEFQQQFVDKFGWTFPIGMDYNGNVVHEFQREALVPRGAIPMTFFIDSEGNILDVYIGPITEEALAESIASLLKADGAGTETGSTATAPEQ